MTSTPEIIPPHKTDALDALEAQQAQEWAHCERLKKLAVTMDAKFKIPGVPLPIGLDSIVGLIPGIGDTISLAVAGYIVVGAARLGADSAVLFRMVLNIFIDWLIGLIPIIGDLFDIGWQGNMRNMRLLETKLEARWEAERTALLRD